MLDAHLIAKTRPLADPRAIVRHGDFRVTVLGANLFRIERDETATFCDSATQAVWFRDGAPVPFSVSEDGDACRIRTDAVTLVLRETIEESEVLFGKKRVPLTSAGNLLGTASTLDCCDGEVIKRPSSDVREPLYLSDGVISKSGVALYDDSASLLLGEDGRIVPRPQKELDLYVFAFGHDYRAAVRALYRICGSVPLVPRFAFGNWWSRYHAYTETEYLQVLDRLARRDVPLTVATIDMDWHWSTTLEAKKHVKALGKFGEVYGGWTGWTGYSWNTDLFPDYRRFLRKIKERNLRITLNLHPGSGVRWFEEQYADMARAVGIEPKTERFVEFDMTNDDFVNAYFRLLHKPYEHDGVDFWWIDWQQGKTSKLEGLDPLWMLNHYHTLDIAKEQEKPLILSRYSGIGSHRYPLGFSGDTYVTWESLDFIPYFTATATNVGYTFWSHDIGGHMFGLKDDELYARYVQFGAFSPINRLHCTSTDVCTKEPDVYMNGAGLIAERFLRLRHQMIPYLYSAAIETHESGTALIEPMYYEYPEEKDAYRVKNEYRFGTELIVAPVTSKGDHDKLAVTTVWLPEGTWTDIFTGDEYRGGRMLEMVRWLDSMPVLLKEGGFFVLDAREHTNLCDEPDALDVLTTKGNGTYTLREDSGKTVFTAQAENGVQTVTIVADETVKTRRVRLEFRNIETGIARVTVNGRQTRFTYDDDGFVSVEIPALKGGKTYRVTLTYTENEREKRNARLFRSIRRFERVSQDNHVLYVELRVRSDEDCRAWIRAEKTLTKHQKKRLFEVI